MKLGATTLLSGEQELMNMNVFLLHVMCLPFAISHWVLIPNGSFYWYCLVVYYQRCCNTLSYDSQQFSDLARAPYHTFTFHLRPHSLEAWSFPGSTTPTAKLPHAFRKHLEQIPACWTLCVQPQSLKLKPKYTACTEIAAKIRSSTSLYLLAAG